MDIAPFCALVEENHQNKKKKSGVVKDVQVGVCTGFENFRIVECGSRSS